jgi:hypothetical protein
MGIIVLILFLVTIAVWIALRLAQTRAGSTDVEARFLERVDYIPSSIPPAAFLSNLAQ